MKPLAASSLRCRVAAAALMAVVATSCGEGDSPSGPAYEIPVVAVAADGTASGTVGLGGDLQVASAVHGRGVRLTVADTLGRPVRGVQVEYREFADSLVVARCTDPLAAHRAAVYLGNPARGAANGQDSSALTVDVVLGEAADLDPYYAAPTYIHVLDEDLIVAPGAIGRLGLPTEARCQRLTEIAADLSQGGDSQTDWAGLTLGLAHQVGAITGYGDGEGGRAAALVLEEAARFDPEYLLDRVIEFINLERDERLDPVDGNTVYTVRESPYLGHLLPEFAGRHLDLELVDVSSCGSAVQEMVADLPNGAAMTFVWIEPGVFTMGSPAEEVDDDAGDPTPSDEEPEHEVTVSHGFWLGKYEITQLQWQRVMGQPPWVGGAHTETDATRPASYISWEDVQELVEQLNAAEGAAVYRLPTEADWEYACRAGAETAWSFGDDEDLLEDYAWYHDNVWGEGLDAPQVVGTRLANPWGLHDLHGNLYEWCQDWYGPYAAGAQVDPAGPSSGETRVVRGGVFFRAAQYTRSADRAHRPPDYRYYDVGARLVRLGNQFDN